MTTHAWNDIEHLTNDHANFVFNFFKH